MARPTASNAQVATFHGNDWIMGFCMTTLPAFGTLAVLPLHTALFLLQGQANGTDIKTHLDANPVLNIRSNTAVIEGRPVEQAR